MLIDHYPKEEIFARVPKMTQRIDPVLQQLDQVLDDDEVYHQVRNDFGKRSLYPFKMKLEVQLLLLMNCLQRAFFREERRSIMIPLYSDDVP